MSTKKIEMVREFLNDLMYSTEKVMNGTGHNRSGMTNKWLRMEFERAYALHCILDYLYISLHETDNELLKQIDEARLVWLSEYIDIEDMYISIWRIADNSVKFRDNNLLWSLVSFLGKATTVEEVNRKYMACKCILGEI